MRIISGQYKGRKIQGPPLGEWAIRPTSDRAREALFSILDPLPRGAFLDLFAGTGAISVEALSRGWNPVISVDNHPQAWKLLEANARLFPFQPLRKDVLAFKVDSFSNQQIVFADPPYALGTEMWKSLADRIQGWLAPGGMVIWETDRRAALEFEPPWRLVEKRQYGEVQFWFIILLSSQV